MYQRACFLSWNSCFRIGWSDLAVPERRTNLPDDWSVNVAMEFKFGIAPDDLTCWSIVGRINTSNWLHQQWFKLALLRATSDYPTLPTFCRKVGNGSQLFPSLFKGVPRVSSLPFEPLNTRGHLMSWEKTSTTWDQQIQSLEECKCARTLGKTEGWSSEGLELVTLGV